MAKPTVLPVVELLTGDEVNEAIARYILSRKLSPADVETIMKKTSWQVSFRNLRLPDGTVTMFASACVFGRDEGRSDTDTPLPEAKNG